MKQLEFKFVKSLDKKSKKPKKDIFVREDYCWADSFFELFGFKRKK